MTSLSHGVLTPERRFVVPLATPTVDHFVRATYSDLLSKPVPERFLELVNRYGEEPQPSKAKRETQDGSED
jgi:hypothetical protein